MNRSTFWLLCLLGCALFNQGLARPQQDDYQEDGEGDDYPDGDEDEESGPPPQIISRGSTQVVEVGNVAFLPCDVDGNPSSFSRIWRKDKTGLFVGNIAQGDQNPRITNLANGTLEIRQIEPSDAGTYYCKISSGKGEEIQHILQVKSAARITSFSPSEKSVNIRKGSSLTLECIAQGYPTPSIKWFRNGHVLEDQDPSIHGARYTITSASLEDSGMYKCTATNGQQMPDEKIVEVEVHYPPQITIGRAIVPTGEGYESELKCSVNGMKKPELRWYRNEDQKPIMASDRIRLEKKGHEHILRILKTQQSDFGDYVCEAKNTEGQQQAIITLTGKPSKPEPDTVVTEGESKNPLLTFRIESFAPIEDYELLYKREESDEWTSVKPSVTAPYDGRFYIMKHTLQGLEPGVYNAQLKAKNIHGWSEMSTKITFPKEHEGDLTETGLLAVEGSAASELRISLALLVSLLVAHFSC
ncbi:neogenin-like [Macrosteles quadrilineatus]|uniref:neogenin-like n=1 Tax=Macrosteles quadrilineatus TaxID=74068 RepID=UPI0023E2245C|nr:neogenin-like [Macrosteles quadrilineatus]